MAATKSWGQSAWTQWPAWGTVCIWARGKSRLISASWLGLSVEEKAAPKRSKWEVLQRSGTEQGDEST